MVYFVYQNLFVVFNTYCKSLIKKVSMSLGCPYCYLLLFIKKIAVNITNFPEPFKIYIKKFLIDFHVKISSRNYWYTRCCQKLLKFLQGVKEIIEGKITSDITSSGRWKWSVQNYERNLGSLIEWQHKFGILEEPTMHKHTCRKFFSDQVRRIRDQS